jgi:hypothetical protein
MKKFLTLLMTTAMLTVGFASTSLSACAAAGNIAHEKIINETTEYFEDGSSVTIIVTEESTSPTRTSAYSKSGSKHYIFLSEDKVELWRFTVHGTFMVNPGISAPCTDDSYDIDISDEAWQNESALTYHSGNQAIGEAVFIEKFLFITIDTINCNVVLSCDSNGNLA